MARGLKFRIKEVEEGLYYVVKQRRVTMQLICAFVSTFAKSNERMTINIMCASFLKYNLRLNASKMMISTVMAILIVYMYVYR